jgi:hypothetical protein
MEEPTPYEVKGDGIVKIPLDMGGKSILVINNFSGTPEELKAMVDAIEAWLNSPGDPLFLLTTRGDTHVEIKKVGNRSKR